MAKNGLGAAGATIVAHLGQAVIKIVIQIVGKFIWKSLDARKKSESKKLKRSEMKI
ncbi:hypothetical protein QIA37_05110 (plasmid) [Borrelia sp. CA_690]|uniref:hypothetical protein n=1 Tax=Borrelia TaxID=138 RepID=UPI00165FB420|nr:hypothetical protein [Borrelia maritima]